MDHFLMHVEQPPVLLVQLSAHLQLLRPSRQRVQIRQVHPVVLGRAWHDQRALAIYRFERRGQSQAPLQLRFGDCEVLGAGGGAADAGEHQHVVGFEGGPVLLGDVAPAGLRLGAHGLALEVPPSHRRRGGRTGCDGRGGSGRKRVLRDGRRSGRRRSTRLVVVVVVVEPEPTTAGTWLLQRRLRQCRRTRTR